MSDLNNSSEEASQKHVGLYYMFLTTTKNPDLDGGKSFFPEGNLSVLEEDLWGRESKDLTPCVLQFLLLA